MKKNALVILSLIFFGFRVYPLIRHASLWAEDANVFYGPIINHPHNPFMPNFELYNGQHWVAVHYLASLIYSLFAKRVDLLPLGSTIVSLVLTVASASMWLNAKRLITRRRNRELIFAFILLAPSSLESLGNLANVYVYLFIGIISLSGWELSRNRILFVFEIFIYLALSLTSICGIFLVVSLFFRAILNHSRKYLVIPFIAGISIAFQFQDWMQRGPGNHLQGLSSILKDTIYIVIKRVFVETLIGQNGGAYFSSLHGWYSWVAVALIPITLITVVLLSFFRHCTKDDLIKFFALFLIVTIHLALAIFASISIGLNQMFNFGGAGRYLLVTHVMVFALIILIFDCSMKIEKVQPIINIRQATMLMLLIGMCFDFHVPLKTTPNFEKSWKVYAACVNTSQERCEVTVPPGGAWGIH